MEKLTLAGNASISATPGLQKAAQGIDSNLAPAYFARPRGELATSVHRSNHREPMQVGGLM
ncbi:hypothetical protein [Paraburkholderia graminis]|uniref:Uncharacterized protein n=1 Tax=Paraburkholderia graminis TaxID=60548 RepID=A0ABD5CS62_9BURK|nr:hypothetical protein [Paraburkholderia graminis]MDR6208107.1 hypothetical protein [Paraburkholderia graminis]